MEYVLLHVQEPILYVVRKQHRHSQSQVTPIADYYIIAGTIYQAPDLGSVVNSRLLTTVNHLQSAFEEARQFSKYHPSKGYWWDFGKAKKLTEAEKARIKVKKTKVQPQKEVKEEPSSVFQRRRVDFLLDLLTRKYPPPKQPPSLTTSSQPPSSSSATNTANVTSKGEAEKEKEVKMESEQQQQQQQGIKREAPQQQSNNLFPNSKKAKLM